MTDETKPLSPAEIARLRGILAVFPDDESIELGRHLMRVYSSAGVLGKLLIGALKLAAIVAAGIIAWGQLRGLFPPGKGG